MSEHENYKRNLERDIGYLNKQLIDARSELERIKQENIKIRAEKAYTEALNQKLNK